MFFRNQVICLLLIAALVLPCAASEQISVMSFNLQNYFLHGGRSTPKKSPQSKDALFKVIRGADPDIIMISEIGGPEALEDFQKNLKSYTFSVIMHGADSSRYIGCIAKFTPEKVNKVDELTYKLKPKKIPNGTLEQVLVQRGFLHVIFKKGDYRLHIINAHLKARLFHPRYNQTDMRRMEARLLKYYVNGIIKKDSEANILVTGDMNDVYSSSPLKTLRAANQKKLQKRLYDLKPADDQGATWTHWWQAEDSYGRIDYFLVSPALLPEIELKQNKIIHLPKEWLYASDHRPIMTLINTRDQEIWNEEKINAQFKDGIYIRK